MPSNVDNYSGGNPKIGNALGSNVGDGNSDDRDGSKSGANDANNGGVDDSDNGGKSGASEIIDHGVHEISHNDYVGGDKADRAGKLANDGTENNQINANNIPKEKTMRDESQAATPGGVKIHDTRGYRGKGDVWKWGKKNDIGEQHKGHLKMNKTDRPKAIS